MPPRPDEIANFWLTPGNTSSANNIIAFLEETFSMLTNKTVGLSGADAGIGLTIAHETEGSIFPSSSHEVTFELNGPGQLIGLNQVATKAGVTTILYRADPSLLGITAASEGLSSARLSISQSE